MALNLDLLPDKQAPTKRIDFSLLPDRKVTQSNPKLNLLADRQDVSFSEKLMLDMAERFKPKFGPGAEFVLRQLDRPAAATRALTRGENPLEAFIEPKKAPSSTELLLQDIAKSEPRSLLKDLGSLPVSIGKDLARDPLVLIPLIKGLRTAGSGIPTAPIAPKSIPDIGPRTIPLPIEPSQARIPGFVSEPLDLPKFTAPEIPKVIGSSLERIKAKRAELGLSNETFARLRRSAGIDELKNANPEQLDRLAGTLKTFKPGEGLLSPKQIESIKGITGEVTDIARTPKRLVVEQLGEKKDILSGRVTRFIDPKIVPTVNIKEGSPLITYIANKSDDLMRIGKIEHESFISKVDSVLSKAEASRPRTIHQRLTGQNPEIFQSLGGRNIPLTLPEQEAVNNLRGYFQKVRDDLGLEKFRKNYVTHLEAPLMERISRKGLLPAIQDIFNLKKESGIPTNIMLELDNIIGSEKFFRFALERKGGVLPTYNLRKIIEQYDNLYRTKKALDQILPEAQAVTQLFLQKKGAIWMKRYLQNLKGRGLDYEFRSGPMGWTVNAADIIVDAGYLKLLGGNVWSAAKNLTAGEINSFIVQDFANYLAGKQRFISSPKMAYQIMTQAGITEGTFIDYASRGIKNKALSKLRDIPLIGQKLGEMEVRGSMLLGELNPQEWATGFVLPSTLRRAKDMIALSQGEFSKTGSPLLLQTPLGRTFTQMNRWRITNAALLGRLVNQVRQGVPGSKARLGKAFLAYGIGMYLSYEMVKAGYKRASQVAKSMAETINNTIELVTTDALIRMVSENPTLSLLREFVFTIQELAGYIGVPGIEKPRKVEFRRGIEDTSVPALRQAQELAGIPTESKKKKENVFGL